MSHRSAAILGCALGAAFTLGCSGGDEILNPLAIEVSEAIEVVPFATPPSGVVTQPANNNLDVVEHEGRYYLAFRTAPTHFASELTELYVVSSADEKTWQFEARFALGTDLREPRLLSFDGQLFLYLSVLGANALEFEPHGIKVSKYESPGHWTEPVDTYDEGFIAWRSKVVDGKPYVVGYVGGENIYDINGEPIYIHWLTTKNGFDLEPVIPGQPIVEQGGGSETDFAIQADGSLIAVTRNEAGDETGWGSKICKAEAGALGDWSCVGDKRKYDSPLVFQHDGAIFLIGRRNLTESGNYDLERRELSPEDQTGVYEVEYSFQPKRCSLWRVDPGSLAVSFVLDLPSQGDTCFPGILAHGGGRFSVYNYTSSLESLAAGEDFKWLVGQGRPTSIVRVDLTIP